MHEALDRAAVGDEIWVAAGEYELDPALGRTATFLVTSGIAVYGGFEGDEETFLDRPSDPLANPTVLSGRNLGPYHVVTLSGTIGPTTVLDGLEIIAGNADGHALMNQDVGGGIYGPDAAPTLRGLRIDRCEASTRGGGVFLQRVSGGPVAVIEDCTFTRCEADEGGGAYLAVDVQMAGTEFRDNTAAMRGGGLMIGGGGFALLDDCLFAQNEATGVFGGGLYADTVGTGAVIEIDRSVFDQNASFFAGGGAYFEGEGGVFVRGSRLSRNTLAGSNSGPGGGGNAFSLGAGSSARIENCLVAGNVTQQSGAGISINGDQDAFVVNTTVTGNDSAGFVAGISLGGNAVVAVENTVVWNNVSQQGPLRRTTSIGTSANAAVEVNRSLVEFWFGQPGPLAGTGTTDADPMFVNALGPDFMFGTDDDDVRPMPGSPVIDAGNNAAVSPFGSFDYYFENRFRDDTGTPDTGLGSGSIVDIGAAEFQGTTVPSCTADTNGDGALTPGDFNAWVIVFNANAPACDQNGDGQRTPGDFNAWILN
ncbi:MAG: right-handed parallel beta-helix repeat-containing protein, partial [Planctomycetota bacterium]